MNQHSSDRNLLFGILALQNDFISREQLMMAVSTWLQDKSKALDEILLERGALPADEHGLLRGLAEKHLERHDHDVEKSLAAVSAVGTSVREELAQLGDDHIETSLTYLSTARDDEGECAATQTMSESPGERYRILRPHATGGLGQVSVALDSELNREVALKEIRSKHADSAENRARFVREAVITGGLEHPGIVPVYGLGHHGDGKPFYAMRFIRGDNLKKAVSQFHREGRRKTSQDYDGVEFRKLLGRFIDVCNAIEYAHSRGVLHRDLKPGNVMVGKYGETLVVDWGLAKSLDQADAQAQAEEPVLGPLPEVGTVQTIMGQTIGTPAYMSPEQAAGRLDQLQPASDVYSLGATLYYLLAGRPPFQGENVTDVLERVRDGSFPAPRQLQAATPVALEAICLKAMALDPHRRYPRAVDLASDVELWLADEPVSAYREPLTVRAARTLRKHRTLAMSGLAVLITATIALAGFSALIAAKNTDLRIARDQAESNRQQAVRAQLGAEENLASARAIALNILEIAEQNLSQVPGKEGFRERMMDRCYAMFEGIYGETPEDPTVAEEFAKVARLSGNLKRLLQKYDEARVRLRRSLRLQESLQAAADDAAARIYLAETCRDLGTLEKAAGDLEAANDALDRAAEMVSQLIEQSPGDTKLRRTQGTIDLELVGLRVDLLRIEQALASATRCAQTYLELADAEDSQLLDPVIAMLAVGRRGQMLDRLDRRGAARQVFAQGIEIGREWVKRNPDRNRRYAFGRLLLRSAEGAVTEDPVPPEAASQIDEALEMFANLAEGYPKTPSYRYYLGDCWRVRALAHWKFEELEPAREAFDQARTILEQLVADVDRASYRDKLAESYADSARFLAEQGDRDAARTFWTEAVEHLRQASEAQPGNRDLQQRLATYQQALERFAAGDQ